MVLSYIYTDRIHPTQKGELKLVVYIYIYIEKDRERQRETERETDRQTDRQRQREQGLCPYKVRCFILLLNYSHF